MCAVKRSVSMSALFVLCNFLCNFLGALVPQVGCPSRAVSPPLWAQNLGIKNLIFLTRTFSSKVMIHNMYGTEWEGHDSTCFMYVNVIVGDKLTPGEVK